MAVIFARRKFELVLKPSNIKQRHVRRQTTRLPWPDVAEGRRRNMRAVRSTNTKPERVIREMLHTLGYLCVPKVVCVPKT